MRFFAATRKGLFRFDDLRVGAATFIGDNVGLCAVDRRDGSVYAAIGHGHFGSKLHRSTDGGETFTEVAVPVYPEKPADRDDRDGNGQPWPWSLQQIWALSPGGADEPGVLWCGTIPGALFRSGDHGASWTLVRSLWDMPERNQWFGGGADLPGIHSVLVHPDDGKKLLVGVSCGGVWGSEDGGETWAVRASGMRAEYMPPARAHDPLIQDPHCLARCAASPEVIWAQHHNGIFRSSDEARSWVEIEGVAPSAFGFAVAAHPRDPGTAWFVPAKKDDARFPVDGKVVVTRTRDGGRSFEALTRGLPAEHAYDLVYRHALDVDPSGEALAFGSTTGSVWVSRDGGESFVEVAAHLPPVYAVRFG
jgi:hypothetical protein